jgi:DNA-binding transcriptional MerR regulator
MIPNKSNFKFQELTPITGVKPYVIRFWETEFPEIAPIDSEGGQKIYSRSDVEIILRIKKFLFDEKLSIPEARARMLAEPLGDSVVSFANSKISETVNVGPLILNALEIIREIKAKRNW